MNKPKLLSIDDEPANQRLIQAALEDHYDIQLANNGEEGLALLTAGKLPDLILLDVNMPGKDGFQVCEEIRTEHSSNELPVLFISAQNSEEFRLKGYDAGGNDYICKPVFIAELIKKIEALLNLKKSHTELSDNLKDTQAAMFSAMSYSGELGTVLRFFEASYSARNYEALANAVFLVSEDFDIPCSMQFRLPHGETQNYASDGVLSPLEIEVLTQAQYGERIFTFGKKSLYSSSTLTILMRDMPIDDEDYCGRIRDHLGIILRACEAIYDIILSRNLEKENRVEFIDTAEKEVSDGLNILSNSINDYSESVEKGYDDFKIDFQETAWSAGINGDQTSTIMESLDRLMDKLTDTEQQKNIVKKSIDSIGSTFVKLRTHND